jgi:hypothetical protein
MKYWRVRSSRPPSHTALHFNPNTRPRSFLSYLEKIMMAFSTSARGAVVWVLMLAACACCTALPDPLQMVEGTKGKRRDLRQVSGVAGPCCDRLKSIDFTSSLPAVIIDSSGKAIPHRVDTAVSICTCSPGECEWKATCLKECAHNEAHT